MLLAIDAGNTSTVFAVYDGDVKEQSWYCKADSRRTADEYTAWLYQLFTRADLSFDRVDGVIISSVVPEADVHLQRLSTELFNCDAHFVRYETLDLVVNLPKPEELGADRLVNSVAVINDYKCPAIVIDFGTATTFDVINEKGEYSGGAIAPGVNLSVEALHNATAKLPQVSIVKPDSVIATGTVSAMQSGIYWGYVGLIEGLLQRMTAELGIKPFVLATGGLAHLFADTIPMIDKVDQDLTLRGLVHIYKQRQESRQAA